MHLSTLIGPVVRRRPVFCVRSTEQSRPLALSMIRPKAGSTLRQANRLHGIFMGSQTGSATASGAPLADSVATWPLASCQIERASTLAVTLAR